MQGLGVPVVYQDQQPFIRQRAGDMLQDQQRRVISPVKVVEHHHQGPAEGHLPKQASDRIEQPEPVLSRCRPAHRITGGPEQVWCHRRKIGSQPVLASKCRQVHDGGDSAQNLPPGPVRRSARRPDRTTPGHRHASGCGQPGQLLGQTRLADARLTQAEHDAR